MWTADRLNDLLSTPRDSLIEDMRRLDGDVMVLGAGGKMGPSLCALAARAGKRVYAVSRFSDAAARRVVVDAGCEIIECDLLNRKQLNALPEARNIIFMAGRKFGTHGAEYLTWAMNATLPAYVSERFKASRIVAFSSGNVYPMRTTGCDEAVPPGPIGEYAMSCLARERAFEYAAQVFGTKICLIRLNYAVDLRYGVLCDMAQNILAGAPISLSSPVFNCIWQGSANEAVLSALNYADAPARIINLTGPETLSTRSVATKLGELLGKQPIFAGAEGETALLNDASLAHSMFGYPSVGAATMIKWQAEWLLADGRTLNKPTHFEEKGGVF